MASSLEEILGDSPPLAALRHELSQLLQRSGANRRLPPLLILGETGTGKGLLAQVVHRASARAAGPFVAVNCAAIPETLLEAELFGFEKGAFTDARQGKAGLFQTAHRGTLFLDELGLLPSHLQGKLLTVLEDQAVRRLGSTRMEPVDVWLLAASSGDLQQAVRSGRFREDLYHRVAVVTLRLPPLRQRGRDVLMLAELFLARACRDYGVAPKVLSEEAVALLMSHPWPGNVRELANVMERVALLTERTEVAADQLGLRVVLADAARATAPGPDPPAVLADPASEPLGEVVADEQARLLAALEANAWNISRTARQLGISRNMLRYRLRKYDLRPAGLAIEPDGRPVKDLREPTRLATGLWWRHRHVALLRVRLVAPGSVALARGEPSGLLERLVEKVQGFGGRIEDVSPSGFVAAFGLEPLEDAPRRAAHAAMALVNAAEQRREDSTGPVSIAVGLHVAQVAVAIIDGRAAIEQGAKREAWICLEALAARTEPDAVVVSEAALPHLERRFAFALLQNRGIAAGRVYRLEGRERTGLGLGRPLAQFVGRQRELESLERCAQQARGSILQVVHVVGEPGIGKSRLVHEFRQRMESQRVVFVQGHCTADGQATPFLPFIEVVRSAFKIGDGEPSEAITGKLSRGLERLGLPLEATLPYLQLLLGLDADGSAPRGVGADVVGVHTREALLGFLRAWGRVSPLVLLLDDVHWIDASSEALLHELIQSPVPLPLLILVTVRPQYRAPWAGRPPVTELSLEGLSEESCLELVRRCPGADGFADTLARFIVERAEGNPLFAEELTRYVVESGAVKRMAIPETLEYLLLARVDQLAAGPRALIETLAVVGPRFPLELARTAADSAADAAPLLPELEAQDLILFEQTEGRQECRFKHGLIRDAIYQMLPEARRAALHEQVAEAIERRYPVRLGEWAEVLAHHYARTPLKGKAVRYLALAGEKSLRVYALDEADRRFGQALDLVEASPGAADEAIVADIVLSRMWLHYYRSDFTGLIRLAERYLPRVEALGDQRRLSRFLFWYGFSHFSGARCDLAGALFERALALGEALGDEACVGYAAFGLMLTYWVKRCGQPRDIVERLGRRALPIAEKLGDRFLSCQAPLALAWQKATDGRYAEGEAIGKQIVARGREAGDPRATSIGHYVRAWVAVYAEQYEEAIELADESLRLSPSPIDRLVAEAAKGAALALLGRTREGLELLARVRRDVIDHDYLVVLLGIDAPYGAAMVLAGRIGAGVRFIKAAIRRFEAWGNEQVRAIAHMMLGEVYLGLALREVKLPAAALLANLPFLLRTLPVATRKARQQLQAAIRIALDDDIPGVEARCRFDLGVLAKREGRSAESRTHLEEALRIAEPLGMDGLTARARAALGSR